MTEPMTGHSHEAAENLAADGTRPVVPAAWVEPEDFPAVELSTASMRTIDAVDEPRFGVVHLDVEYAVKDGVARHLQVLMPPAPTTTPPTPTSPSPSSSVCAPSSTTTAPPTSAA